MFRAVVVGEADPLDVAQGLGARGAALRGPLLGLADEERTHKADDRGSTCEDAHHIRLSADLLVQALLVRLVLQIWRQSSLAEVPEGEQGKADLLEVLGRPRAAWS